MNTADINWKALKRQAKDELGGIDGVEGFGVGDDRLIAYVRDTDSAAKLPEQYQGIDLETVVSGEVNSRTS
ncbi:MAG: hypothetical protein M3Y72_10390 [Acidobacteriota bacterium]|nr:hypothetical protein [Acidobacteriota bacterium]MDQ2841425.1 hypothetical protein [Acidobacteriota bacterium]